MGYLPYQLVQDFFHQQYDSDNGSSRERVFFGISGSDFVGLDDWRPHGGPKNMGDLYATIVGKM